MADNYTIPKANAPFLDGSPPPRREWYNFLRGLYDLYESSDVNVQAQITQLCYKLGSPDGTIANIPGRGNIVQVQGLDSINAMGLEYVQLALVNDIATAPALSFYGAITAGSKGWQHYSSNFQKTTTLGIDYLDLVDLVDSGTGAFKLLARDTKGRLSGTKDGTASDVPVTNTGWTILTGSNIQTALDSADANFTHVVSTGVHYGMQITINGTNPSAVDISAGNGDILNNTIPSAPTYTTINFAGQTGIAVINTTAPITYWSIDSAGVVHQSIVAPTPDEYRTSIQLGSTMYNGGVITQVAHNIPSAQQAIAQIGDLYEALGFVNYGLYPYANGANLNFNVTAGRIASYGANFFVDPLDPNFVSYAAKIPVTFRYGTQSTQSSTNVTTVDVANYDVGGVVTPIPGSASRATIQTVWQLSSGAIRVQYGEQYYNNINEALANIATRSFIPNPTYAAEGGIIGAIVVEKSATDLSNTGQAIFVKANKFGEFVSGSGSSTSVISFNGRSGVVLPVSGDYTTDLVTEATNLYFTQPRVLATPLTGLSTATSTPITASDTVLSAAGKLQAQITGLSGAPGYIDGLVMQWVSGTALTVSSGTAYIEGLGYAYQAASPIAKTSLSLSASTWYHVYLYDNAGTPDVEIVTTAPAPPYNGTARSKTGDSSKRYVGSLKTDSIGNIYSFQHDATAGLILYQTNIGPTPFVVVNGSAISATSVSCAGLVPATSTIAKMFMANNDTLKSVYIGNSNYPPTTTTFISYVSTSGVYPIDLQLNSSQEFQYLFNGTPTANFVGRVAGYLYER